MQVLHSRIRISITASVLLVAAAISSNVSAQSYPYKPIRVLASEPGAQVDITARTISQLLTPALGQQVIVDNRPGIISVETAAKSPPDGYTLLFYTSAVWVLPLVQKVSFDATRDFTPITLATNAPLFLFTNPSLPVSSAGDLISYARSKPGALNYGSAGTGTSNHLAAELFKNMAGVDIVRVPYKGAAPAAIGVISNQVQLTFSSASLGMPHVKAGKLKVLGVAGPRPSALAPDVPTISASGLPGYEAASMACIWAPVNTPKPVVTRLNQEIVRALTNPQTKEKLLGSGVETTGSTPEQAAAYIKSDIVKWSKVIKDAGIRQD